MDSSDSRLDVWLVACGRARSRAQAAGWIRQGRVRVNEHVVTKSAHRVIQTDVIEVEGGDDDFVGRGGQKLAHALKHFRIDVSGRRALDVGASTGGFTDCLLRHGVREVVALDVGHGQMRPALAADPRVIVIEGVNARHLPAQFEGGGFELIVIDVSFISLTLILPAVLIQAASSSDVVVLIKPQFELSPAALNRSGVVRSLSDRLAAVDKICRWFDDCAGWSVRGVTESPVVGGSGNHEYLLHAQAN